MIAEISAAMSSLNATKDIVKGITALRDANAVAALKIQLQSSILDAQEQLFTAQEKQSTLTARIYELEQQIMRMEDWSTERSRYELKSVAQGAFAYMLKPEMAEGQPPHWLCTSCFDARKKSILQVLDMAGARLPTREWGCPACKATISVSYHAKPTYEEAA